MFGNRITLFKLLGFDIKLDLSWVFIAVLISWSLAAGYFPSKYHGLSQTSYWFMGIAGALGLFVSIILHELGHSVIARRFAIPIQGITLFIFGGVAEMEEEPPNARAEFWMALAGPAVSILIAIACYPLYTLGARAGWPPEAVGVLYYLSWMNGLLAAFNLVPAFPLDGGRLLRAILWGRQGNLRKATKVAAGIGSAVGVGLIVMGIISLLGGNFVVGLWWFLIGLFLRNASEMSYRQMIVRKALEGEPIERFMKRDPVWVPASISIGELVHDYIYKYHYQMFPVMRDSKLLGCISTKQVKTIPREDWDRYPVQGFVTPCATANSVNPKTDAIQVLALMQRTGNSRMMVIDQGRLVGVITLKDLLQFLSLKLDLEGEEGSAAASPPSCS